MNAPPTRNVRIHGQQRRPRLCTRSPARAYERD